ncbi:MAG: hypothetical protein Ta2E_01310 [Mycoplasmoidaceae bacterium]|nr:MAG: hypothetical protein Ta2E_01310 [Mycoplasmoidaceae bacterium]
MRKVEAKISLQLTNDYKKNLQEKHRLGIEEEFYLISKTAKDKYQCSLKDDVAKLIKPKQKTNNIVVKVNYQ